MAGASTADLDEHLVAALVRRLRATRGSAFANAGSAASRSSFIQSIDGPIPAMVAETLIALRRNMEDVEVGSSGRTICENRGSGLLATAAALRGAGMEPPVITDNIREFRVAIKNHGLLDEAAVARLSGIDTAALNDRQRLGLAFLYRRGQITNQDYRSLTGTDPLTATRELTGLGTSGLIEKRTTDAGPYGSWPAPPDRHRGQRCSTSGKSP